MNPTRASLDVGFAATLVNELGPDVIDILARHERAWVAELKLISTDEAQRRAELGEAERIGGYPVRRGPFELSPDTGRSIAALLVNRRSYDIGVLHRCKVVKIMGLKFVRGSAAVEIVITSPCAGTTWWTRGVASPRPTWAEVLGERESRAIFASLPPSEGP